VLRELRSFFETRDFLEVETPIRIACPAVETHIDAEPSGRGWLRTSPELHMKRLLAEGMDRIFQVGPCFRKGEFGRLHHPEYSMLEWYRAGVDDAAILNDTQDLLRHLCRCLHGSERLPYQGQTVDLAGPWCIKTVREEFLSQAGWDPFNHWDADRFDVDLVEKVEPSFPLSRPVIFTDYPPEAAALSVCEEKDGRQIGRRWELYLGGLELANAYTELTDPVEQRTRFEDSNRARAAAGREPYPLDEAFLEALEKGLPACAGIALGVDRLAMLFADAASLDEVIAFRETGY
jgi:lysyl-tRNA synthetase class 2